MDEWPSGAQPMASKKTTIKGRGPEIFGRGIDLLFGEAEDGQTEEAERPGTLEPAAAEGAPGWPANAVTTPASGDPAREEAYLDLGSPAQPAPASATAK